MQFLQPKCYKCRFFKSAPKTIGGKAICTAYPNGIPKKVFFEGGVCSKKPKTSTKKRGVKSGSRKK